MLSKEALENITALPPFADERNKALAKEIQEKQTKLAELSTGFEDQKTRAAAMQEHMRNIKQEIVYTQALYDARNREIDTENHLKHLAEREMGRIKQDMIRIANDASQTSDKINTIQRNIYKDSEKMEKIRNNVKIEKEELEEWLKVQQEKDDDNVVLQKYAKEDELKIKHMSMQIQKLTQDLQKKKHQLMQEVTETQLSQLELTRAAENFRKAHQERQDLLRQWEMAVQTMQKRDEEIAQAQQTYEKNYDEAQSKRKEIMHQKDMLEGQLEINEQTERKIELLERAVAKSKTAFTEAKADVDTFQDELSTLKMTLQKTSNELQMKRNQVTALHKEKEEKFAKLSVAKQKKLDTEDKLLETKNSTKTLEQKNIELDQLLEKDVAALKDLERQQKALKEKQYKAVQEQTALKNAEKALQVRIGSSSIALKNAQNRTTKLEQESLKQQALLYTQSYQVQLLERKVRRASGERSDEEKAVLQSKISELTADLETWKRKVHMLNTQFRKSLDEVRESKRHVIQLKKEGEVQKENISELNLYIDTATNQLAAKIREKEELLVDESILRLELRKLQSFLNTRADDVFSLENRHAQLQIALEERTKEIEIHKEMLRSYLKIAEEERYKAAAELRERMTKVGKLRSKYEIIMRTLGPDNEEFSQAYLMIQATQKKEELQREGDELNDKLRKAEREIKALNNTLSLMNNKNDSNRTILSSAIHNERDIDLKDKLEAEVKAALQMYKSKRADIEILEKQVKELEQQLALLMQEQGEKSEELAMISLKIQSINLEIEEQGRKKDRAFKQYVKAAKEWRENKGVSIGTETEEELDVKIKELRDFNRTFYDKLTSVSSVYPDISEALNNILTENNINPPSASGSVASSRISSRASLNRSNMSTPATRMPTPFGEMYRTISEKQKLNLMSGKGTPTAKNGSRPVSHQASRAPSRALDKRDGGLGSALTGILESTITTSKMKTRATSDNQATPTKSRPSSSLHRPPLPQ